MPRNLNRPYKKGTPHRDYRKFVIVAEGEREDEYFAFFNEKNQRIVIEIVERDKGKSAPKYFVERLETYDQKFGIISSDLIWFVLDVDRWTRKGINDLYNVCQNIPNYNIAISNPCFEVWLYNHFSNISELENSSCSELKTKLNTLRHGGYKVNEYALEIENACQTSRSTDTTTPHYFPEPLQTKVYLLGEELIKFLGKNWK